MRDLVVRPYNQADRDAFHRIGADTAFFGDPVEVFLDDRRLFCDAFYAYYTDLEPERSWVACVVHEAIGFVAGCVDTRHQQRRWRREILPGVVWRALRGSYRRCLPEHSVCDTMRQKFRNSSWRRRTMSALIVQIRRKGVITLPIELRKRYSLNEGDVLTLEDLGDGSFLLTPRVSQVAGLGDRVAKVMEEEGVSAREILETLEEERESYYREHYVQPSSISG